jgi:hypothetical protein
MISNLKLIYLVVAIGLPLSLAPHFPNMPAFAGNTIAYGTMPDGMKKAWVSETAEILGCYSGCDLTLKECERDDPDCQLRPALLQKLPATMEIGGPSLVQIGGCTCGCGYKLVECEEKHKDCTQRPRLYQQLKRLAVKYGYEKAFMNNSGLIISGAEGKMFSAALKGSTSLLYVHNGKSAGKSAYMKTLLKFQNEQRERVILIPISLVDKEEKNLIKYYQVENPSIVMVAPNGAVTAIFKGEPPYEKLKRGLVSPKMEEILLAIQQGMTTFLCVGRPKDRDFEKTKQTIISAIRKLGGIATAVWLDPGDRSEQFLLSALKYQDSEKEPPVFVIAPTGLVIEKIGSGLTERMLFDSFQRILAMKSGCGQSTITGGSACQPGYGVAGESSCR